MQQSKAKPIFTRKEYLANTSRQEFIFLNSFQALVSNSLFLPTLLSHSVLGEAWKSYTGRLGESRHAYGPEAAWPTLPLEQEVQYVTAQQMFVLCAFPQCVKHLLYSASLLGKWFMSKTSTGRIKGVGGG